MLEKIKAEIFEKHKIACDINCKQCIYNPCWEFDYNNNIKKDIDIIDNHIKELKGGDSDA